MWLVGEALGRLIAVGARCKEGRPGGWERGVSQQVTLTCRNPSIPRVWLRGAVGPWRG